MAILAFVAMILGSVTFMYGWFMFQRENYTWQHIMLFMFLVLLLAAVGFSGMFMGGWYLDLMNAKLAPTTLNSGFTS